MTELQFALDVLTPFILFGVVVGVVVAIVVGFAKVAFKLAPYIVIAALIYYAYNAMQFAVAFQ